MFHSRPKKLCGGATFFTYIIKSITHEKTAATAATITIELGTHSTITIIHSTIIIRFNIHTNLHVGMFGHMLSSRDV